MLNVGGNTIFKLFLSLSLSLVLLFPIEIFVEVSPRRDTNKQGGVKRLLRDRARDLTAHPIGRGGSRSSRPTCAA